MPDQDEILGDEIILRHIPGGTLFQAPGPRITSSNFKIRHDRGETGVSITRGSITSPSVLLTLVQTTSDSKVGEARAGDIRALGLKLVPKPLPNDPGHSEIQSGTASLEDAVLRKKLARRFRFVP